MPTLCSFSYAIVRVVPQVEREEFINVGAIVFCEARDYLAAQVDLDERRLALLCPTADIALIQRHLVVIPQICEGGRDAGAIGALPLRERWNWLIATRSTVVQTSPAHAGMCERPEDHLAHLIKKVVRTAPVTS